MRRFVFLSVFAAALVGVFTAPAATQPPKGDDTKPMAVVPKDNVKMDEETKKAVDKALKYLADKQEADGAWGNTAITGFTLLAFMANGHMPNQGDHGKAVAKGIRYLCSTAREDGYLVGARGEEHPQHHIVRGPRGFLGEQLLDDAGQAVVQLVGEAQMCGVVHLLARAVSAARLFRKLVQKQVEQPRLVDGSQLCVKRDFGVEVHDSRFRAMPGRNRSVWWW